MKVNLWRALAAAFLAGDWTWEGLFASGADVVGGRTEFVLALSREVLLAFPRPPALVDLAAALPATEAAGSAAGATVARGFEPETTMTRNRWHLPVLETAGDVARHLHLDAGELAWFADPKHLARATTSEQLLHYRVSTRVSPSGQIRVLEAPKARLKLVQRRLLHEILDDIPAHDAAHGFVPKRSVATYAAPHAGQRTVVHLDLEGFFASVPVGRVHGLFRTAGYPDEAAHVLAGLTTTVLPRHVFQSLPEPADTAAHWRLGRRLATPHLPQGAPTSPALANLAAYRLDVRLTALAASWGGGYTRYADDLALSGGWNHTSRLVEAVHTIALDEGFRLNDRKTTVQRSSQRQMLTGLVVNERPKVARREVDTLRATLHNCVRHGPSTQGVKRDHLVGRVAWVTQHDPSRGARLQAQLAAVDWTR